jgi:DNA-binding HxlR family transcriptional regulator
MSDDRPGWWPWALEIVGERWAMLIVRDLLVGQRRDGELAAGLPRIPSNILASRLKELQAAGVIRRMPRLRVIIYELTSDGPELEPVVLALGAWGSSRGQAVRTQDLLVAPGGRP